MENSFQMLQHKSGMNTSNYTTEVRGEAPNSAPVPSNIYVDHVNPPYHPPGGFERTQVLVVQAPPPIQQITPLPFPIVGLGPGFQPGPNGFGFPPPVPPPVTNLPPPKPPKKTAADYPDPRVVCRGQSKGVRVF